MYKLRSYILCCLLVIAFTSFKKQSEWTSLLDRSMSRWETYLSYRHTTAYNGEQPKDANGKLVEPIGYNTKQNVFTVIDEKGEPVIRVSGEVYGCVYTKEEFENYHLKLKVKWGRLKHEPRTKKLKDSGILYHSIGQSGVDYWRAWMLAQEFQIMEGHMGDYWNIATSAIDIRAYLPEGKMNSIANAKQPFLSFGTGSPEGFCMRSENNESADGEWTTIELICYKGKSLHIVNGKVVMVLQNSRYVQDGNSIPLTKGKIQLQSEGAEVFYKDIQIKKINNLPSQYAGLF
jgi:hypothetical protein